jgi:membrane-bound inhibitor of C-type lysozyme
MRLSFAPTIVVLSLLAVGCSREEHAKPPVPADAVAPVSPAAPVEPAAPAAPAIVIPAGNDGHDYGCDDGISFNARIDKGDAVVTLDGQTTTLHPVEGASGAQYGGEGLTYIAQGAEAMLVRDGQKTLHCTAK